MGTEDRYLSPGVVMANRFANHPRPAWRAAILCFNNALCCEVLIRYFNASPLPGVKIFYGIDANETEKQVFEAEVSGHKIGIITRLSWGGPQAAILVEELAHLGVSHIIGYGAAGSIDMTIRKGDLIVASNSLLTDGTSRAYLPNEIRTDGDEGLLDLTRDAAKALDIRVTEVTTANVDALYRETRALISEFQRQGAQAVNLETSALYASARVCEVHSVWLGFISDSLVDERWDSWDTDHEALAYRLSRLCHGVVERLL
ncbi:hypothetical protein MO973_23190 [Paenibacillus sp. TRM 82003]|nr:hypothetical protein [Paenibacillus sp. TRM 82003]